MRPKPNGRLSLCFQIFASVFCDLSDAEIVLLLQAFGLESTPSTSKELKVAMARYLKTCGAIGYTMTHCNAISCYFKDPDDNVLEVYWPTGLEAKQGFLVELDFNQPEVELIRQAEEAVDKYGKSDYVDWPLLSGK